MPRRPTTKAENRKVLGLPAETVRRRPRSLATWPANGIRSERGLRIGPVLRCGGAKAPANACARGARAEADIDSACLPGSRKAGSLPEMPAFCPVLTEVCVRALRSSEAGRAWHPRRALRSSAATGSGAGPKGQAVGRVRSGHPGPRKTARHTRVRGCQIESRRVKRRSKEFGEDV